jgi:alkylated DNA nucleotide flippase Atl1
METFSERVIALALKIPRGKVTTYKILSRKAGGGGQSHRSISAILGKAWDKGEHRIPWHRIVYSDGKIWVSEEIRSIRMALYKKEGIKVEKDRIVDFREILHEF